MSSVFVVAEAGSTHDGDYEKAIRLIQVAKDAGADACKFQYFSSGKRLAERRHAPAYEAIYTKYQVPVVWLSWLAKACEAVGMEFMSTCYLPEDIATVAPFVQRFKVASFEAGDRHFIRCHEEWPDKQLIVSTGMMDQIPEHLAWVPALLHCVSAYPTPPEQANLAGISPLRSSLLMGQRLQTVGYSDHTRNVLTGAFAVCAGAQILEVHFRLDDTSPENPDYATALTPAELTEYVRLVRLAEVMLGSGIKAPQPAEAEMAKYRVQS